MTLRIAMVGACPFPVPQGSQVLLKDTARGLHTLGHDVHLVVYGYGVGEDPPGLTVHRCPNLPGVRRTAAGPSIAKLWLDAAMVVTLRRVTREYRIDIVHAHNYEALAVAFLAGKRPIVYHGHNAMADELPFYARGVRAAAAFGTWLDRFLPRRADHVIAPHARLAQYLIECGCAEDRLSVIPPSVDPDLFEPARVSDALPPVLYTGNLDTYQNLGLLLRAMEKVRAVEPQARLMIATADVRDFPGAERVTTPDVAGLSNVLGADSVFVCPRVAWSGYPMKILNAMAAGKAVVACRSSAYPITHQHDGLVVDDNDADAFASAVLRLMRDPRLRARLGQNARETVMARHHPAQIAAQVEAVYHTVLQRWQDSSLRSE